MKKNLVKKIIVGVGIAGLSLGSLSDLLSKKEFLQDLYRDFGYGVLGFSMGYLTRENSENKAGKDNYCEEDFPL